MKRFFNFLAKKINYTAAVSITTMLLFCILIFFLYIPLMYLIFSTFTETAAWLSALPINLILVYILVPVLLFYCVPFGILGSFKVPAFLKSFREINSNYKSGIHNRDLTDEALLGLYNKFNRIIIINTIFAAAIQIYNTAILIISILTFESSEGLAPLKSRAEYITLVLTTTIFFAILTTILSFFYTDALTKQARGDCYKELWKRGHFIEAKSFIKLKVKFYLIIFFQIVNIFTFAFLFKYSKFLYNTAIMSVVVFNTAIMSIVVFLILSIVTSIILVLITYNPIQTIFKDLANAASQISRGMDASFDLHPIEKEFADTEFLILSMNHEIIEHRRNLEQKVEDRTAELQKALINLKERDDLLQKQLDMAGSIQRGILPGKIEDWNELKFSTRYFSMDKIGGDFYDVSRQGNKIIFYMADVSGHGIPAALVTTMAKVSFGNAFLKYDSPRKIFREVNHELLEHVKTQDYLTCFMAVIDDKYNLTYANASHQKAILLRTDENRIELLDTGGLFIAAIEDAKETYEEKTTSLRYNDRLILYTDGIPEASNSGKEHYSNERFEKAILKYKDLQLKEFTNAIVDDLQQFTGGYQVQDDITLLIVELVRDETFNIIKRINVLNTEKKHKEAIELIKKGLEQFPDNQKLLYNLAKTFFRINDYKNVIKYINKYIESDKENKYAYYLAGAASYKIMNYNTAIEFFQRSLSIDPNFVNALFAMGMTYKEIGQTDEANRSFEKIKNIDDDNKTVDYELSRINS